MKYNGYVITVNSGMVIKIIRSIEHLETNQKLKAPALNGINYLSQSSPIRSHQHNASFTITLKQSRAYKDLVRTLFTVFFVKPDHKETNNAYSTASACGSICEQPVPKSSTLKLKSQMLMLALMA